jgi:hypothetical protein
MLEHLQISALTVVFVAVWGILLFLHGVDVSPELLKPFEQAVGAFLILLTAFEHFLWKVPVINGWLVKRPNIAGTWKATFQTTWKNPETGEIPGPTIAFMVVRQTFSDVNMTLLTKESSSHFVADELSVGPDGQFAVHGVYLNEPKATVRHRSAVHYGALKLTLQGSPAKTMEGVYWTDRLTRGDLRLEEHRKRTVDSYEDGVKEYGVEG